MEKSETKTSGQEGGKGRESRREWEDKLDDRVAFHLTQIRGQSLTLEFPVTDSVSIVRHYRLTDEFALVIRSNNCREMDRLRKILSRRCRNCDHVISFDEKKQFAIPLLGAVCETCHDLYKAVTFNVRMRNMNYFKEIQEAEDKRANDKGERGGWRDRAGM
jgi:hypothetical protein